MCKPVGGRLQWGRGQRAVNHATGFATAYEPSVLEGSQVLGEAGQGHFEGFGQIADRPVPRAQRRQDPAPGRVGQGREHRVEVGLAIQNHMVKY